MDFLLRPFKVNDPVVGEPSSPGFYTPEGVFQFARISGIGSPGTLQAWYE
jgi:hypothetical protein